MKNLIICLVILSFGLISCNKDTSPYGAPVVTPKDTNSWKTQYNNGGVLLPGTTNLNNVLFGTKWILTRTISGFGTTNLNDTIIFINNTDYKIGNNTNLIRNYQLGQITGSTNKSLTLNLFSPFGGSNYTGQVGETFVTDGYLNNIRFKDTQNGNNIITAWFKKI